ncbi:cytochrome c oxidase subunit 3 [Tautonia marina]|uniref:cytochrome c oxidase subunit 3 n=1 Tax=Tautonia marina TaxID=2653855 RepID=UPI0012608464|nr:cytochrome c oxidase subunit 3 [Tautonia marina]
MAETPPFGEEPTGAPHDHEHPSAGHSGHPSPPPATPGKVALWLFLATEVMFFTGLIGSYVVLRAGSPPASYSNLFAPETDLTNRQDAQGVVLVQAGPDEAAVVETIQNATGSPIEEVEHLVESAHDLGAAVVLVDSPYSPADVGDLYRRLQALGAEVRIDNLESYSWPEPYQVLVNPLSIDLTAINTFILICSSVTMVLALAAIQRGDKVRLSLWLLATILIGSTFLSIQIYEYYQLMVGHQYSVGVSETGHFRPSVSLFASAFFTMTGFHGAHVTGGVIALTIIWLRSLFGGYTQQNHAPVELAGLYWHFVDLVWIILFTVVYLI